MREIVFDTETTGLDPAAGDRVTEIGCVEVIDCIPTGRTFHTYCNPQRDVPQIVTDITGLTAEFLADKPLFAEIVDRFLDFAGDAGFVAHNAPFDRGFINMELTRLKRPVIADDRFRDTVALARKKFPGSPASLDALCKRFNISLDSREKHGALTDALLLADVYLELNGGRERALDLAGDAAHAGAGTVFPPRAPRPVPLAELSSPAERAAHADFIKTLGGGDTVWKRTGGL